MTPSRTQELAVLRSVTYAAMFEYPLSLEQLHASLIGVRADAATVAAWWRNSELLQATIDHQEGLYFPAARVCAGDQRARPGSTNPPGDRSWPAGARCCRPRSITRRVCTSRPGALISCTHARGARR